MAVVVPSYLEFRIFFPGGGAKFHATWNSMFFPGVELAVFSMFMFDLGGGGYVWNISRSSDRRDMTRAPGSSVPVPSLLMRMGVDPAARAPLMSSGESPT